MEQRELPLLQRIDAPATVPPVLVRMATTYREAVRLCWALRRAKGLRLSDLARDFGMNRQHIGDYLNGDDKPKRRNLPAHAIADFEAVCGNTLITQWLAARHRFTVVEELQAERNAA